MSGAQVWTRVRLNAVPRPEEVCALVRQVTAFWADEWSVVSPGDAVLAAGWQVKRRRFAADARDVRSLLIPRLQGGFSILVNSSRELTGNETDWLIAHEYAHSLFYRPGDPPARIIRPSVDEEGFCDRVADRIVGIGCRPSSRAAA
jgi:hypothetical protein